MIDIENIPIGYIFPEAKVLGRSKGAHNPWILKTDSEKNRLLLRDEYIPHHMRIKRGEILHNLVLIGYGKKVFHVALGNYEKILIDNYYCYPSFSYKPRKECWRKWQNSWQVECSENFKNNFSIDEFKYKTDDLLLDIFWLKGKNFILPVFGYKDLDALHGTPLFYPDFFDKNSNVERSVYKTDGIDNFPQMYTAKITGENSKTDISRDILIFFHGFTYPAKWHLGVWKHILAQSRDAREKEKAFWEKIWNTTFPVFNNLFKYCKTVKNKDGEEVTCDENACLSLSLFKKIHLEIKNFCRKYLEQFVTSFEFNTTNNIVLLNGPFNSKKILFKYVKQWTGIYQKTIIYGVCHNWDDMMSKPVFHVCPVTMFLDNKLDSDWLIREIVEDNNKKCIAIFNGSLSGIKKCSQ